MMADKKDSGPLVSEVDDLTEAALTGDMDGILWLASERVARRENCADEIGAACGGVSPIRALAAFKRAGVDISAHGSSGMTPLHWACAVGNPSAVEALLIMGARRNVMDSDGRTPFSVACSTGSWECAGALVRAGHRVSADEVVKALDGACRALGQQGCSKFAGRVPFTVLKEIAKRADGRGAAWCGKAMEEFADKRGG